MAKKKKTVKTKAARATRRPAAAGRSSRAKSTRTAADVVESVNDQDDARTWGGADADTDDDVESVNDPDDPRSWGGGKR